MYKQRDFLEDSDDSSSFDGEPGTPPPFYQKAEA